MRLACETVRLLWKLAEKSACFIPWFELLPGYADCQISQFYSCEITLWNHIVHALSSFAVETWRVARTWKITVLLALAFSCFFFVSDQNLTLEELLKQHTTRVLSPSSQRITVRRSHILDDAVGALRCGFVETKRITIHFLGESAIDEGGPRREFFMLLMGCIANNSSILIGPPGSRVLRHNTSAFQVLV